MTIFNSIISDMVSKITSKVFSKEDVLNEKTMVEISAADCGAVAGGPQVENDTQA